jgi:two-component system, NarL family, nitrate/nitrite response regulator NarL
MNMTTIMPRVSATSPKNSLAAAPVYGAAETMLQRVPLKEPHEESLHGTAKRPIKILVVDDHPVVRRGISACLARQENLSIVGEAVDGRDALRKVRELRPDIVLMDIDMPQMSGLTAADILRREMPQVKVLVLSMHSHTEYVLRIIQSGACGYVLKGASPDELAAAIERVSGGEAFFSPEIARVALNQFVRGNGTSPTAGQLTSREREVLIQIAEGMSNKEIACFLGVGVRTVETHRERIMRKLNIHSIAGLTRFAISQGLVSIQGGIRA